MAWTKEERQEYDHHYYLAHREKRLAQNKVWREANKEYLSEYNHKRYLMNREKIIAYQKEYQRKKKEKKKMKDEKVISYTSTRVMRDKKGRKLLIKMSAEILDTETMRPVSLQITDESKFKEARQAMLDAKRALTDYILACDDN